MAAQKYRLNVDTDAEHELTDEEIADLVAFGFEVKKVGGKTLTAPNAASAEKEKN